MSTISKLENRDDFYVEKHINIDNYVLQDKIGSGSFSKVFKVLDKQTGLICAAKISIQKIFEYTDDIMRNLTREINIISKINHPCVLSFIGFSLIGFKKSNNPVIITEYASNGTLNDLIQLNLTDPIKSDLIFNDTRKLIIIYGIAAAMTYLHSNNIIHRDLKPENILINDIFLPKIADFGLSKFDCLQGQNNQTSIGEIKGTPKYISPEIWGKYQYTKAADVYAFGMIVFDIFSKENPFKNIQYYELIKKINEGFRPEINPSIPKPYKDLIMKCWSDEPNMRPTFDEIVDTLKNDRSFITEKVIEEDYLKYIDFIDHYNTSFDSSKFEINLDNSKIVKPKLIDERKLNIICQKDYIFDFFPYEKFSKLNKKCQKLVFESNNDQNKQFLIGKCLVEGSDDFPIDSEIGVMFLRSSIEKGSKESLIYYIKMLIKGDIIPKNVKKVKKLLKKYLDEQDPYYLLLYGKLLKKENKIDEARNMFYQSAFLGNEDAMYEYSKLIINDKNKSILYCKKAIEKGCLKAIYKYGLILLNDENHYKEGIEYIKKAADEGLPKANYQYSQILEKENKEEYVYYLKKAAIKGYANAMYKYGLLLSKKEENKQESIQYLEKACDKNQLDAIYCYGLMLKNGIDVNENLNKAAKLIKISADNGNSESMLLYAEMLSRGEGVFPDEEETIKYYKMAINKDHIEAMYQYSHYLQHMSKCTNKEEIVKYYKMAADKGHLPALIKYIYTLGTTPEETEEKFKYLKIAIELGYDDAICSFCGRMRHAKRDGITDIEGKINYIKNLIEKGNVTAMDFFGRLLIFGEDFIINKKEAFNYFKMAIEHGNIKSIKNLQYCFDFNEIADDEQINYIIYLINTKKNEIAAYEYAEMLRYGRGVPVNKEEALKYYKIAADSGTPIYADDYASLLFNGEISEINKSEAFKYYKLAVDAAIEQRNYVQIDGNNFAIKCAADSCFSMLFYGDGITQNKPEALKYIKFLADRGYVQRMYNYSNYMLYYDIIPVDINEAIKYYKMAINRGSANAMYCYGHTLAIGNHVPINKKEAIKYYKMAIEKGQQEAMIDYADMLIDGNGIQQNQEEGIEYYKMAIDKGNGKAMNDLGQRYGRGVGMPINYVEAAKYFKMSADAGYSLGIANYGFMLQNGKGIQMNKQEAIKYYKLAIDKNESVAMYSYAKMLKNGEGISQNIKEAIKYFKMSINYGYTSAMATYGEMLENGDCVQVDIDKAIKYYKMAIEKGNPLGMFKYANLLKTGKGVSKNIDEAIKYYKLAIKNGSDKAMNAFGYMLEIGDGIQMNKEEAIKYYKMAIDKGNSESMRNYARLLENGDGISMNKEEAIKYYKMAADKEEGNKYQ